MAERLSSAMISRSAPGRVATCPYCGSGLLKQQRPRQLIKRGALEMRTDPAEFTWNGEAVLLSPLESNVMAVVMMQERATLEEIAALFPQSSGSMKVIICRIRKKFRQMGAENPLETIPTWGLKLRVERDHDGLVSS